MLNTTFGECLSTVLEVFKLKSSELAKGINVDPSLVYKWIHNRRVPSYKSPYIHLITSFLIRSIHNSFQRTRIMEQLLEMGITVTGESDDNMEEAIQRALTEAQGYSIELYHRTTAEGTAAGEVKAQSGKIIYSLSGESTAEALEYTMLQEELTSDKAWFSLSPSLEHFSDLVRVFEGHERVFYAGLELLKKAESHINHEDDTILLTFNSSMSMLYHDNELSRSWKKALSNVLKLGWKVILLIKLSSDFKRTIRIVDDIKLALRTKAMSVYYYKKEEDGPADSELLVVPGFGALYSFSSKLKNQVDSAFLFQSKASIKLLSGFFFQLFSSAKPLIKSYPSQDSTEFQSLFADLEESLGNRCVFKNGLSTITIPMELYRKYLICSNKTPYEIEKRLFLHQRRLSAFHEQIRYYSYRDICFREAIERLILKRQYSFDEYYLLEDYVPQPEDIRRHINNLIELLEKNKNYNIALVDEKDYESISNINWLVKECHSMLIETHKHEMHSDNDINKYQKEINLLIEEKEVVKAFQDCFDSIWDNISDECKDKQKTIRWLKSMLEAMGQGALLHGSE